MIEWDAPEHLAGLDIDVEALEGQGPYHLQADIIGTTEMLSREAILNEPVLLQVDCRFFDDCSFRYDGLEMRGDGSSFTIKFKPTAGFTSVFGASLHDAAGTGVHLRLAIYPPDSISTTDEFGTPGQSLGCDLPPVFTEPAHDVGEITLGAFVGPGAGRQSWGEAKCASGDDRASSCCVDPSRVGPPEAPCDGNYRHFPGQSFTRNGTWPWTCPYTGEYILQVSRGATNHSLAPLRCCLLLSFCASSCWHCVAVRFELDQVTANCDVPLYGDPNAPGCVEAADGLDCEDDAVESCAAAIDLTITTTDVSVHVTRTFELPILAGLHGNGRRALQRADNAAGTGHHSDDGGRSLEAQSSLAALSSLFRTDQQAGLAFPTVVTPFDCDVPEHQGRPICRAHAVAGGGGGHRRRRLQQQQQGEGGDTCPHADFVRRQVEMLAACGLTSDAAADAGVLGSVECPSLECAEALTSLVFDCAGSIEHLGDVCNALVDGSCEQKRLASVYYQALERSPFFADCEELEQTHAQVSVFACTREMRTETDIDGHGDGPRQAQEEEISLSVP
eukprot:SAG22_NODE_1476_length_4329_cov_2.702128_1_plen_560_part_00